MAVQLDIVDVKKWDDAIAFATEKVYFNEIVKRTPAKSGDTKQAWEFERAGKFNYLALNSEGQTVLFLELGVKPHKIRAKNRKFLKFELSDDVQGSGKYKGKVFPIQKGDLVMWINKDTHKMEFGIITKRGKKFLLIKEVNHPGFEARRFIQKTFEDPSLDAEFEKVLYERIKKLI